MKGRDSRWAWCLLGVIGGLCFTSPAAHGEARTVDTNLFLTVVEAQLASGDYRGGEQPSIVGNFFHTGDRARFIATVESWLAGVVVDPGYLRATNGAGVPGFTQPSGWTGFSQSLVQSLEQRYNGYIILARFDPNNAQDVATATHEAIHAFALAVGSGLDRDEDGAPEFLSNQFIYELLPRLRGIELSNFAEIFKLAWDCKYDDVARQKNVWLTQIAEQEYRYANFSSHNLRITRQLVGLWGGSIDWDGYIAFVEKLGEDDTKDDCD